MKAGSRWGFAGSAIACLVVTGALLGVAQNSSFGDEVVVQNITGPRPYGGPGSIETDPIMAAKRLKAMNADRHKSMVSDTEKLVKLARQLDAEIASNSSDGLTSEELHKVAEIEKLARNVKAKMAQSFDDGPKVGSSFTPLAVPNR